MHGSCSHKLNNEEDEQATVVWMSSHPMTTGTDTRNEDGREFRRTVFGAGQVRAHLPKITQELSPPTRLWKSQNAPHYKATLWKSDTQRTMIVISAHQRRSNGQRQKNKKTKRCYMDHHLSKVTSKFSPILR